jgi:DNA polymerase I-like protein with 3'-5' exonuclease and polymerase domains
MLQINQRYRVALTVHDAAVCVVPAEELDEALAYVVERMSEAPDWARGLPVACEAHYGESYGDMVEYKYRKV